MNTTLQKRIFINQLFHFIILSFAAIIILVFGLLVFDIFAKGLPGLSLSLFLETPAGPNESGGGILNALIGTLMIVCLTAFISIPLAIFLGVFLAENTKTILGKLTNYSLNMLLGIPSILTGIIAFIFVVNTMKTPSLIAACFALSLIMIPFIAQTTKEALLVVSNDLREASYALGISYQRTLFKVILPACMQNIFSGVIISISRISGETAPLLFTAFGNPYISFDLFKPIEALPLLIFNYAMSPYESWQQIAWSASLILILFVLVLSFTGRWLLNNE